MGSIPVLRRAVFERHSYWQIVYLCERVAALVLLVLTLPLTLIGALLIRIVSGRTPLIAHRRVGQYGATLWVLKLRTMWDPRARGETAGGAAHHVGSAGARRDGRRRRRIHPR